MKTPVIPAILSPYNFEDDESRKNALEALNDMCRPPRLPRLYLVSGGKKTCAEKLIHALLSVRFAEPIKRCLFPHDEEISRLFPKVISDGYVWWSGERKICLTVRNQNTQELASFVTSRVWSWRALHEVVARHSPNRTIIFLEAPQIVVCADIQARAQFIRLVE